MGVFIALIVVSTLLFCGIYIFEILACFGKCGKLMRGYNEACTNLNQDNKKEQKFVLRVYAIKSFIVTLVLHASILSFIFKQYITGGVLLVAVFVVWGIIELTLKYNKKYQTAKYEISDERRTQSYYENLKNNKTE